MVLSTYVISLINTTIIFLVFIFAAFYILFGNINVNIKYSYYFFGISGLLLIFLIVISYNYHMYRKKNIIVIT